MSANAIEDRQPPPQFSLWDQWEGESLPDYKKFTFYLSLGLGRSVQKAALEYREQAGDENGQSNQSYINEFNKLALRWQWQGRADNYDISVMKTEMRTAEIKMGKAVVKMAEKLLAAAESTEIQPSSFKELMDGIHALVNLIPPSSENETSVRIHQRPVPKQISRSLQG